LVLLGLKKRGERLGNSLKDRGEQKWLGPLGQIETEAAETAKDRPDGQVAWGASRCCRRWTLTTPRTYPEHSTRLEGCEQCRLSCSTAKPATSCLPRGLISELLARGLMALFQFCKIAVQ
jgi:hypothetical protein